MILNDSYLINKPEMLAKDAVMKEVEGFFRDYATSGLRVLPNTKPARVLFVTGQHVDWYHSMAGYKLPQWLVEGLDGLVSDVPCTKWGVKRDKLVNVQNVSLVAADVAVAAFVNRFFKGLVHVDVLDACNGLGMMSPNFLDGYDAVMVEFDFHHGGIGPHIPIAKQVDPIGEVGLDEAYAKTTASLAGSRPKWNNWNTKKFELTKLLRDAGLATVPTVYVPLKRKDGGFVPPKKVATKLLKIMEEQGWNAIFCKPDKASFMQNVRRFDRYGTDRVRNPELARELEDYVQRLQGQGKTGLTVQIYLESFKENWELRMYFFGGRHGFTVTNRVDADAFSTKLRPHYYDWDFMDIDGGNVDSADIHYQDILLPLARKALRAIRDAAPPHTRLGDGTFSAPSLRVDMGCCLHKDHFGYEQANGWFINEVEPFSNINAFPYKHHTIETFGELNYGESFGCTAARRPGTPGPSTTGLKSPALP